MTSTAINWFEIPVNNVAKSKRFYESVLGVELGEMPGPDGQTMKIFMGADGPCGALLTTDTETTPGTTGPRIYLNCKNIDSALQRVVSGRGRIMSLKKPIGPHGFVGSFQDLDGNVIGLHQRA